MRILLVVPPIAALVFPPACSLPVDPPTELATSSTTELATSSTTELATSSTTELATSESTGGCYPHFSTLPLGGGWGCFCNTVLVDPVECGCVFDDMQCTCPAYPCEEHPCELPCEPYGELCQCGSLVVPADGYCS